MFNLAYLPYRDVIFVWGLQQASLKPACSATQTNYNISIAHEVSLPIVALSVALCFIYQLR